MIGNIFDLQYSLKQVVDHNGDPLSLEEISLQEELALKIMSHFIGCTLVVHGRKFILAELELYYGGIGDVAHDWYKTFYSNNLKGHKPSKTSKETAKLQANRGPIYYFNKKKNSPYKRCDIVIGGNGVAVSFLIRNVLDENLHPFQKRFKERQVNMMIRVMNLTDDDLGEGVLINDTHEETLRKGYYISSPDKRVLNGKASGFPYSGIHDQKKWNLSLKKL